ncbi:MAG: LemA family protein [Rhodospirillum sp.]|nr:LemA family protein [Rhodospirillum sp.]MCF8487687.1 LemA family protein [Rhodospirillum sp.]MCF8499583.1 LemA family protein [Rhodospirillum sp.]
MTTFLVILALIVAAVLLAIVLYNGLVKARQMVEEGWSGIDVQLKRRADLIPNLVETVKGYATHEKSTFEEVVTLRDRATSVPSGDVEGRAKAEGELTQALGRLFALTEAYPDLKANQNFADLQDALETIEGEIQMSRRYYNGAVRHYNIKVDTVPSNLIAGRFGFEKAAYFEISDAADRITPKVSF